MTTAPTTTRKPRRRWLQFSLRTLLVLMLVTSVPLGRLTYKLKQTREQRATDGLGPTQPGRSADPRTRT